MPDRYSLLRLLAIGVAGLQGTFGNAQPIPDQVVCGNEGTTVLAPRGYDEYYWSPRTAFSLTNGYEARISRGAGGEFRLRARTLDPQNYVLDPGFDAGGTGMTSAFRRATPPSFVEGSFAIVSTAGLLTGPHEDCPNLSNLPLERMLVAHGPAGVEARFWCQAIDVIANEEYQISFKSATFIGELTPALSVFVDEDRIGSPQATDPYPCVWRRRAIGYKAPTSGKVTVCLAMLSPPDRNSVIGVDEVKILRYGPDYLDTFNVAVIATAAPVAFEAELCRGSSLLIGGKRVGPGTGEVRIPLRSGCDSVVRYSITEVSEVSIDITASGACATEGVKVPGYPEAFRRDTSFMAVHRTPGSCDTVFNVALDFVDVQDLGLRVTPPLCGAFSGGIEVAGALPSGAEVWWGDGIKGPRARSDLPAGKLAQVSVRLSSGCAIDAIVDVPSSEAITAEVIATADPVCRERPEGSATVAVRGAVGNSDVSLELQDGTRRTVGPGAVIQVTHLPYGDHELIVMDARGCEARASITLVDPGAPMLAIEGPALIPRGLSGVYQGTATGPWRVDSLTWSFRGANKAVDGIGLGPLLEWSPPERGEVVLKAFDNRGCITATGLEVSRELSPPALLPSAFSPDGNGVNDFLRLAPHPGLRAIVRFEVYDRWGGLISLGTNLSPDAALWQGADAAPGEYAYRGTIEFADGTREQIAGSFALVR